MNPVLAIMIPLAVLCIFKIGYHWYEIRKLDEFKRAQRSAIALAKPKFIPEYHPYIWMGGEMQDAHVTDWLVSRTQARPLASSQMAFGKAYLTMPTASVQSKVWLTTPDEYERAKQWREQCLAVADPQQSEVAKLLLNSSQK